MFTGLAPKFKIGAFQREVRKLDSGGEEHRKETVEQQNEERGIARQRSFKISSATKQTSLSLSPMSL